MNQYQSMKYLVDWLVGWLVGLPTTNQYYTRLDYTRQTRKKIFEKLKKKLSSDE
jgi:hypothetical protein